MTHRYEPDAGIPLRREELNREGRDHPSPEDIGRLIEGGDSGRDDSAVRAHLVNCRRCFALYAELSETDLQVRHAPAGHEAPADWTALARRRTGPGAHAAPPRRVFPRFLIPGFAAIALLLAWAVTALFHEGSSPPLPQRFVALVEAEAPAALPDGWMVGDLVGGTDAVRYRSGAPAGSRDLEEAVRVFTHAYEDHAESSAGVARALVLACLADRDHASASAFLNEARRRWPDDVTLAQIDAALELRASRLDDAGTILRAALDRDPSNAGVLADLGFILAEQDRGTEARALLARVVDRLGADHPSCRALAARLAAPGS